jgi:cytoskeleton protein RodZ
MQSIGERFEEARKRKGISLREAAEATKIRGDFLAYFEQDKFDFELPEIYKRGFIKNYARYLKLDPDKTVTDYNAYQLSKSRLGKKNGAELFGTMEVKSSANGAGDKGSEEASYGTISAKPIKDTQDSDDRGNPEGDEGDKVFYIKAGLVFVGTLALVFVLFGLIKAILGSGSDDAIEVPDLREPPAISESARGTPTAANPANDTVTLTASGDVYVLVKQRNDNQILYRDTMSAGQAVALEKSGPVDILFTAGENILIDHAGERMRPSSSGTAKITLP